MSDLSGRWRMAAVVRWYDSQDHVGQADTDPEPYASAAGDAAVRVVLEALSEKAAGGGNSDDGLWYRRFQALLDESESPRVPIPADVINEALSEEDA